MKRPLQSYESVGPLLRVAYLVSLTAMSLLTNESATFAQTISIEVKVREDTVKSPRLLLVATIGDSSGPGAMGRVATITRLNDGRYFAVSEGEMTEIKVFSAEGQFEKAFGGYGSGPGEFGYIGFLQSAGNNLHVIDYSPLRHTAFNSRLQIASTSGLPAYPEGGVLALQDGRLVLNALIRTRDRVGYRLHTLNPDGGIGHSFSENPDGFIVTQSPRERQMRLSLSRKGTIWASPRDLYRAEEWTPEGVLLRSVDRQSYWTSLQHSYKDVPAQLKPEIIGCFQDSTDGFLWIAVRVPDKEWSSGVELTPGVEGDHVRVLEPDLAFDTIVDVIDLDSGILEASGRFNEALFEHIGGSRMVSASAFPNGFRQIKVWRFELPDLLQRKE